MFRCLTALLLLLLPAYARGAFAGPPTPVVVPTPTETVQLCLQDARKLPKEKASYTRYLDGRIIPEDLQKLAPVVLPFHANQLSREPDIVLPRLVAPNLWAIDLRDYAWDYKVWRELGNHDFVFHHVGVEVKVSGVTVTASAEWLAKEAIAELVVLTESYSPVIPLDWFVNQTAIQADRDGFGYFDFLGLGKKQEDFLKLAGVNEKEAKRLKLEMAASVAESSVTHNNRAMRRLQALTGAWWSTQDFKTSTGKQNTIRLLDGDTEPPRGDAEEQYAVLPNGLFAFWLQNGKGERQDSAPDFIAGDGKSPSTDKRVHICLSCIRCHGPGLQPIDDWARKVLREPLRLQSPDYEKFRRLQQLYLSDLDGQLAEDNAKYAKTLKRVNGLSPQENAKAFAAFWTLYNDRLWAAKDIARRCGTTEATLMAAIRANTLASGNVDLVVAGLLATPPVPLKTRHVEELMATFHTLLAGYKP